VPHNSPSAGPISPNLVRAGKLKLSTALKEAGIRKAARANSEALAETLPRRPGRTSAMDAATLRPRAREKATVMAMIWPASHGAIIAATKVRNRALKRRAEKAFQL
jgi:hypothetical protein